MNLANTRRDFIAALIASAGLLPRRGEANSLERMLWQYTLDNIRRLDERRRSRLEGLQSPEELAAFQQEVRTRLASMWGQFPERTPLDPRPAGTVERPDYRIEKLIYTSRPGFHVTANLYLPQELEKPAPALVFAPGAASNGKAYDDYQRFCVLLVRHGFIVLVWDPISRGERLQLWDQKRRASRADRVPEEVLLSRQCFLLGSNLMQYRIWDAVRAVDYLESRPEVDSDRIAAAGESAGGMDALSLAACDSRLKALATVDAVTSFRSISEAGLLAGPTPVLYQSLRHGIDHQEIVAAISPRPLLVGTQKLGVVPVEATRAAFREAIEAYRLLNASSKALMVTSEQEGFGSELRSACTDWMLRWLTDGGSDIVERPAQLATEAELRCYPGGQVAELDNAKTIWAINREIAIEKTAGAEPPRTPDEFRIYSSEISRQVREKTRVGEFRPEPGIFVPDRRFEVGAFSRGVVIVVSDLGHESPAVRRRVIDPIVAAGYQVIGLDVRGWGRSHPQLAPAPAGFWEEYFANRGLELGRPLLGQRMRDLLAAAPKRTRRREWTVVGVGAGALVALHAAVIDPRVERLVTVGGLLSFRSLVEDPLNKHPFSSYVPGVIGAYDVRDLYAALAPRPVLVVNPVDSRRTPVHEVKGWGQLDWVSQVYEVLGNPLGLTLKSPLDIREMRTAITDWLQT